MMQDTSLSVMLICQSVGEVVELAREQVDGVQGVTYVFFSIGEFVSRSVKNGFAAAF